VVEQGAALALGGAKQRAVLAILLIHRGEVLSSERLVDELWGERPPTTAAKTLQGYVSRLRQAIGGGVLQTHGRGYRLALEPGQVDVDEFQRLAATGRVALRERDAYTAAERLRDALGVWRGAALADFAYEPFAQDEIARLEEARIACHEDRIDAELALGRHAEAVGALEPLIAAHPFRERLRAQLMLALYRCDRQADALQAYQDARNKLTDELGIEPSERLRQLERAILAQDPSLALHDRGQLAAKPATPATRAAFVDREAELGELVAGLDDAFAGRGRLFWSSGSQELARVASQRSSLAVDARVARD
jgi:DNA-binding SARP family transcriptional activator